MANSSNEIGSLKESHSNISTVHEQAGTSMLNLIVMFSWYFVWCMGTFTAFYPSLTLSDDKDFNLNLFEKEQLHSFVTLGESSLCLLEVRQDSGTTNLPQNFYWCLAWYRS